MLGTYKNGLRETQDGSLRRHKPSLDSARGPREHREDARELGEFVGVRNAACATR